ncbi:hypothetical protein PAHAL_4G034600 [Panicum hallii]|uniref:Uncharacterized protein n=1 Tax=Panicum hallii TaxID=206008 RepID=A0A2T8JBL4_9POAL|nr:hypothetical protein PAHAL_4G034600 [Panicum hallii]
MRRRQVQIERQGRAGGGRVVAAGVFAEDGRRGSAVAAAVLLVLLLRRGGAARQGGGGGAGRAVAPRLYGAAVAGRGRCCRRSRLRCGGGGGRPAVPRRGGRGAGEVGAGGGPAEGSGGGVVGARGGLGGVEGAEPDRGLLSRVPDLGGVAPRRPPPHAAVPDLRRRRRLRLRRLRPAHRGRRGRGAGGWGGGGERTRGSARVWPVVYFLPYPCSGLLPLRAPCPWSPWFFWSFLRSLASVSPPSRSRPSPPPPLHHPPPPRRAPACAPCPLGGGPWPCARALWRGCPTARPRWLAVIIF